MSISPKFSKLIKENTIYTDQTGKTSLLADKEKLANLFWTNFMGFIILHNTDPSNSRLTQYFKSSKVQLNSIDDQNNDLTISIKLLYDAKMINDSVANQLTKFLALIKQGKITTIDQNLLRDLIGKILLSKVSPDSKIKLLISKFSNASITLNDMATPLFMFAKKNQISDEFVKLAKVIIPKIEDDKTDVAANQQVDSSNVQPIVNPSQSTNKEIIKTLESILPAGSKISTEKDKFLLAGLLLNQKTVSEMKKLFLKYDIESGQKFYQFLNTNKLIIDALFLNNLNYITSIIGQDSKLLPSDFSHLFNDTVANDFIKTYRLNDFMSIYTRKFISQTAIDFTKPLHIDLLKFKEDQNTNDLFITSIINNYKDFSKLYDQLIDTFLNYPDKVINAIKQSDENVNDINVKNYFSSNKIERKVLNTIITTIDYDKLINANLEKIVSSIYDDAYDKNTDLVTIANSVLYTMYMKKSGEKYFYKEEKMKNALEKINLLGIHPFTRDLKENNLKDVNLTNDWFSAVQSENDYKINSLQYWEQAKNSPIEFIIKYDQVKNFIDYFKNYNTYRNYQFFGIYKLENPIVNNFKMDLKNSKHLEIFIEIYKVTNENQFKTLDLKITNSFFQKLESIGLSKNSLIEIFENKNLLFIINSNYYTENKNNFSKFYIELFGEEKTLEKIKDESANSNLENTIFMNVVNNFSIGFTLANAQKIKSIIFGDNIQKYGTYLNSTLESDISIPVDYLLVDTAKEFQEILRKFSPFSALKVFMNIASKKTLASKEIFEFALEEIKQSTDYVGISQLANTYDNLPDFLNEKVTEILEFQIKIPSLKDAGDKIPPEKFVLTEPTLFLKLLKENPSFGFSKDQLAEIMSKLFERRLIFQSSYNKLINDVLKNPEDYNLTTKVKIAKEKALTLKEIKPKDIVESIESNYGTLLFDIYTSNEKESLNDIIESFGARQGIVYKMLKDRVIILPLLQQIMGSDTVIKPEVKMDKTKILNALKFNNFHIDEKDTKKINKSKKISHTEYLDAFADQSIDTKITDLQVSEINYSKEDLEKITGEYYKHYSPNYTHGNVGLKFLKAFDVHLEFDEYNIFKEQHPGTEFIPAFHGTGTIAASFILRFGFKVVERADASNMGVSVAGKALGNGVYFAKYMDKSAGYVRDDESSYNNHKGNIGYIFEMEAVLGKPIVDYNSAGYPGSTHEGFNFKSPEYAVFNARAQLKIVRAYKVMIVSRKSVEELNKKYNPVDTNESYFPTINKFGGIKKFKQFLKENEPMEDTYAGKNFISFTFFEPRIPISKTEAVTVDEFIKNYQTDKVQLYGAQNGFRIEIEVNDDMISNVIVPNTDEFVNDDPEGLASQFLFHVSK